MAHNDNDTALNREELGRLKESITASRRKLHPFRRNQLAAIKQYVGTHYSDNGASEKVPVNSIELAMNIYIQHLAARRPNTLVTTRSKELKPVSLKLEIDINGLLKEMKFGNTMKTVVTQAMFSLGIIKVGLHNTKKILIDGQYYPLNDPFAVDVSLDNWVHDMTAEKWDYIQYCGDRYTVPVDDLDEMGLSETFIQQLTPNDTNANIDEEGLRKASSVTQEDTMIQEQFRETVDLWDIWLPFKNVVITIADEVDVIGKTVNWDGPKAGPYRFLSFSDVIDNIMPLPPVAIWMDLHMLENSIMRKLGRQVKRQKTIVGVQGGADEDGNRIIKASDGDMVKMENPKATQEYRFGGVDQASLMFMLQVKELTNYYYGNINAMGGLDRQSETLGQDRLLTANASKRLESMQAKTIEFTTAIIQDIGWYRWTDPIRDFPININRYGMDVSTSLTLIERETDYYEFNFDIEAFSMQHQTPESRVASIMQIYDRVIAPFAQQMAQQGIFVDFEAFLKIISKYMNLPEINDILIYAEPQQPDQGPKGQSVIMNANTTRKYIREGRPGPTSQGSDRVMAQLLAGNMQDSQKAQLTRS